jgi:maleylacetoacetate isomerase/maleylpyruvate isomerase
MKLYTYWRSQASYRVRIALRLKGLVAEMISLDLLKGDQFDATYRALNPEMVVPTLIDGDGPPLVQSLAILEYLGEKYPQSPLLPADLHARAHARGLAQMLAMDAHPFIVPRVRKYLEQELHLEEPARMRWLTHWLDAGSRAIEDVLARDPRTGRFCCGDHPTSADICLVAHLTSAKMLCDRSPAPYPTARRIFNCLHGDRGICSGTPAPAGRRANDGGDMTAALIVVYVILGILYESRGN